MLRKILFGFGGGGMLTFLEVAHMVRATQDLGRGGGDVNVPGSCSHG